MPEVKISKETTTEPTALAPVTEFDFPLFPAAVFGTTPFTLLKRFADEFDRGFGYNLREFAAWKPVIEVKKDKDKFLVHAEIPGVKKEDVKITVTDKVLVIEGERKLEKEEKGEGYFRSERNYGKFYRAIPLPEGAKTDAATANFADGVLEITIPAPEVKKIAREIPVAEGKAKTALTH